MTISDSLSRASGCTSHGCGPRSDPGPLLFLSRGTNSVGARLDRIRRPYVAFSKMTDETDPSHERDRGDDELSVVRPKHFAASWRRRNSRNRSWQKLSLRARSILICRNV